MKILITGVAGLLGSRMAEWFLKNYPTFKIAGVDDLSGGYLENIPKGVKFYNFDLKNPSLTQIFDVEKPDYVYHFAAYAAEGLSPFIRSFNYQNNLVVTACIVNECIRHNVKRLIFTSSMSVYGRGEGGIFHEDMRRNPIDPYGVAKAACEQDIEIAFEQHGLDYCIIRPHNMYGINQNIWDKYRNVLGIWMYFCMNEEPITIYGDGTQKRAFSYIDDSLAPMWKAAIEPKASAQIINLGSIHEYTINEAAEVLSAITGSKNTIYLEARHEVHYAIPTYQKSVDILGFEHKTDLREGLIQMWEWAKLQPKRERFIWPSYELNKGIYSYWKNE